MANIIIIVLSIVSFIAILSLIIYELTRDNTSSVGKTTPPVTSPGGKNPGPVTTPGGNNTVPEIVITNTTPGPNVTVPPPPNALEATNSFTYTADALYKPSWAYLLFVYVPNKITINSTRIDYGYDYTNTNTPIATAYNEVPGYTTFKIMQSDFYGPSITLELTGSDNKGENRSITYTVQQNFVGAVGSGAIVPNINVTNENNKASIAFEYSSTGNNTTTFGPTQYTNIAVLNSSFNVIGRNCDTNTAMAWNKPGQVWLGIPNSY
jgi:hypothetical protein